MVRNNSLQQKNIYLEDNNLNLKMTLNQRKRPLTLNLHSDDNSSRSKGNPAFLSSSVLSSPDVKKFQLTTPEVEKFILSQNTNLLQTPTPNTTQLLFPRPVIDDPELYSQELVEAFSEFPNNDSIRGIRVELPKSSSSSNSSLNNFMNMDNQYPQSMSTNYSMAMSPPDSIVINVKEEPQTVPSLGSTPPLSPINMESQERQKLERKRQRNRLAASKCRRRKLERIAKLEEKVKSLKNENSELGLVVIRLKEEVCKLKEKVIMHANSGCRMNLMPS